MAIFQYKIVNCSKYSTVKDVVCVAQILIYLSNKNPELDIGGESSKIRETEQPDTRVLPLQNNQTEVTELLSLRIFSPKGIFCLYKSSN